jgi:nitroreductase/dihydropteridine reductase
VITNDDRSHGRKRFPFPPRRRDGVGVLGEEDVMTNLMALARTSHLVKHFDGSIIPEDKIAVLRAVLHSAPSSFNIQATHYVIAASSAARTRIAKSVVELNEIKILTASHVIVFASRKELTDVHLKAVAAQEHADGRFPTAELEMRWRELVKSGVLAHEEYLMDMPHWIEKQTYLALGIALMTVAELGLDALPMEGFNPNTLDEELGLREMGYRSTVLLALGRQSPSDYIINTPKSRLPEAQLFTVLR